MVKMTETIKEVMELLIEYANGDMSGLYPPEDDIQELVDYILDLQEQLDETRKSELDKEYRINKAIAFIKSEKAIKCSGIPIKNFEAYENYLLSVLEGSDKE